MARVGSLRNGRVRSADSLPFTRLAVLACMAWMVRTPDQRLEFVVGPGPLGRVLREDIAQADGGVVSFRANLVERPQAPALRADEALLNALPWAARPGFWGPAASAQAAARAASDAMPGAARTPSGDAQAVLPPVAVPGSGGLREDGLKAMRGGSASRTGTLPVNACVQNTSDRPLYETPSSPGFIPLEPRRRFGLTAIYKSQGVRL